MHTAPHHLSARLRGLLLFILYVTALWAVGWYNFRVYSGSYNTIVTDTLLSAAFLVSFFPPLFPGCRKKAVALLAALLWLGAAISFFALQP